LLTLPLALKLLVELNVSPICPLELWVPYVTLPAFSARIFNSLEISRLKFLGFRLYGQESGQIPERNNGFIIIIISPPNIESSFPRKQDIPRFISVLLTLKRFSFHR